MCRKLVILNFNLKFIFVLILLLIVELLIDMGFLFLDFFFFVGLLFFLLEWLRFGDLFLECCRMCIIDLLGIFFSFVLRNVGGLDTGLFFCFVGFGGLRSIVGVFFGFFRIKYFFF